MPLAQGMSQRTQCSPQVEFNIVQPITIGTLALLREADTPPMQWPMCRVIETQSGSDGIVRVVTVKTATGVYKRCVKKLCPLPLEEPELNKT